MGRVFTIADGLENMGALRTGGQGSVYKGRRMGPIISAVKILPTPIYAENAEDDNYRNFQNEVEKLKKVNEVPNPNVVKILNSGITESGSLPFIEMEFIEGPDLEELLKPPNNPIFTVKEAIKLADQLAGAIAHCHNVGVKHGDIKSNNVKLNIHSGNYVLLDFGLSVMSDEQRRSSLRHAGAIEFMAPEQNEGSMLFQTDIYSYGVVLYELLAGQVPFPLKDNGETARNAVMISHMDSKPPDLLRRQHLPENWSKNRQEKEMQIPGWLLNMISICLEKSPEKRYSNGIELQEAILINSIIASRQEQEDNIITVLKTENEKLQAQLLEYQQKALKTKNAAVLIPKSLFIGLILLLIAAVTYGGYNVLSKKSHLPLTVKDSTSKTSPVDAKSITKPSNLNPPVNDTAINPAKNQPNPLNSKKKTHRKKKKKFLGIF